MRSVRRRQTGAPSRRRFRQVGEGAFSSTIGARLDSVEPMTSTPPAARSSLDARSRSALRASEASLAETRRAHSMSLLWWVFLANGAVLIVALLLLTFSPIEIDAPIKI